MYDVNAIEHSFLQYARGFLTDERDYSRNIQLKITHTLVVRRECRHIADSEQWNEADGEIGEIIGLLHDYGRFEQFRQYRTFADAQSLNHGELSAELVEKHHLLDAMSAADRATVLTAILNHNKRLLPDDLSERDRMFSGLVRDADKLDIMRVLMEYYADQCRNEAVTMGLLHVQEVSPEVLAQLQAHESPRYQSLRTIPDFVLMTLSWAYDLNFKYSRREYIRRGLLEQMHPYIADIPEAEALYREIVGFLHTSTR